MISKWRTLPMDLVNKVMSYHPIESPAMTAWKTATIRMVSTNELEVDGEIKLNEDDLAGEAGMFLSGVDLEYYLYLLTN